MFILWDKTLGKGENQVGKLTAAKAKSLTKPGRYGDGGGLYLRVAPGGSRQWVQRLMTNRRRRDLGLGGFPVVSLAEARTRSLKLRAAATEARFAALLGKRVNERRKVLSFREAAEKVHETKKLQWKNAKHAASWMQSLERYAHPIIGELALDRIERKDILGILTPIWAEKPETARRVRQRMSAIFEWAIVQDFMQTNPAGEILNGALPRQRSTKSNFRALPYAEIPSAIEIIEASGASLSAKLCFRFLILTACRSGEVRNATWDEIDLEARTWKIPGERMKANAEHRVPLSDEALAVLEKARTLSGGEGLIFPSPQKAGKPLSDMSLTKLLRDNGLAERATIHGMRSAFRDWCAETGVARELAEAALAHVVGGVEGAYFRSDLFERRRAVMQSWADYLSAKRGGKVVALHA